MYRVSPASWVAWGPLQYLAPVGQRAIHSVGINAYELFTKFLVLGGTTYKTDLATMASYGIRFIRVSATFGDSADYPTNHQTYIGTVGAAPVSTYLPALVTFLDECQKNGIGVVLVLNWRGVNIASTLSTSVMPDLVTASSVLRKYLRDFTRTVVRALVDHPAVACWELGNEWDNAVVNRNLFTTSAIPATLAITGAANNGSGLVRVTYAAGSNLVTGVPVRIDGVGGTKEANGEWTLTVISDGVADLQGSAFTNAWTSGGTIVVNFLGPYLTLVNELVAEVRKYDGQRAIMSPQAAPAWTAETDLAGWARRVVDRAGDCTVVTIHPYPDLRPGDPAIGTGSAKQLGMGEDLSGLAEMLRRLKAEAGRRGKAVCVGELCAFYDSPPNRFTLLSYQAAYDAGIELVFDWTWYTTSGGVAEDLKTNRAAVLPVISAWNLAHTSPPQAPAAPSALLLPQSGFVGLAAANSQVSIPLASGELEPVSGATPGLFHVGFWISKDEAFGQNVSIITCGTTARGWSIVSGQGATNGAVNLHFAITLNGSKQVIATSFPVFRPFERHRLDFLCDLVNGYVYVIMDGLSMGYATVTVGSGYTPMYPTRSNMFVGADVDGSGNPTANRAVNIADLMISRLDALPATADFYAYATRGTLPPWVRHRWRFAADAIDTVGGIAGVLGAGAGYGKF